MKKECSRRDFLKTAAVASTGLSLGTAAVSAASYRRIPGANDRIHFAVIGVHGRGREHIQSISAWLSFKTSTEATHLSKRWR